MGRAFVTRVIRVLLLLEGVQAAMWIAGLLPSLGVRDRTTVLLMVLRVGVSVADIVAFMLLVRDASAGRSIARGALGASALLMLFEIGWRLVPTNMDPTYRWWFVAAYWGYAALARQLLFGAMRQ